MDSSSPTSSAFSFSTPLPMENPRSHSKPQTPSSTPRSSFVLETTPRPLSASSSSRTIYSDCFIPNRTGSNFALFDPPLLLADAAMMASAHAPGPVHAPNLQPPEQRRHPDRHPGLPPLDLPPLRLRAPIPRQQPSLIGAPRLPCILPPGLPLRWPLRDPSHQRLRRPSLPSFLQSCGPSPSPSRSSTESAAPTSKSMTICRANKQITFTVVGSAVATCPDVAARCHRRIRRSPWVGMGKKRKEK